MVGRRKPLVLASTKAAINSVFNSSRLGEANPGAGDRLLDDESPTNLLLPVGILRFTDDGSEKPQPQLSALDDAALVGLSTSLLKTLSITSGSLVILLCYLLVALYPFSSPVPSLIIELLHKLY